MKNDKLIDAIGRVDDDLIEEAETMTNPEGLPEKNGSRILRGPWKELLPTAAVILLVVGLGFSMFTWGGFGSGSSSSSAGPDSSTAYEESTTEASSEDAEEVEAGEDTVGSSEIPIETEAAGEEAEEAEETQESASTSEPDFPGPLPAYIGETELLLGNYTWTNGDETAAPYDAYILDCEDLVPVVQMTDGAVTLEFEEAPDDLTAICYPGDAWGLTDIEVASVELTVQGTTVYLPDSTSDWIVVATATWDSWQSWSGACEYWFVAEP